MNTRSGPTLRIDADRAIAPPAAAASPGPRRAWQTPASLLLLLLSWSVASMLAGSRLFPGPIAVATTLLDEALHGPLLQHLGITLARVGIGFAISMLLGTAIGIVLGRHAAIDRWLHPWVIALLNVPALVVIILTYVWLGLVESAVLVAVALNKIPNVAITVREGARSLNRDYLEVAELYRLGWLGTYRYVVLPQLWPYLLAAARNGLALIWKIVLIVELLGRSDGIGFQLHTYFQLFDIQRLLAYSASFIVCVMAIEWGVLAPLERHLGLWRR